MLDVVHQVLADFLTPMEGEVRWMYQDHLGLVTVGIGNLIDSPEAAWATRDYGAPFLHGGDPAREAAEPQVREAWQAVKKDPSLAGRWPLAEHLSDLRLSADGVRNLVRNRLVEYEQTLYGFAEFADHDSWPADAQLALASMTWAMGAAFAEDWPNLRAACAARRWLAAASECNMSNHWMLRRNAVDRGLFRNAAWVDATGADPTQLYIGIPGNLPTLRLGASDEQYAGQGYDVDDPVSTLQRFLAFLGHDAPATGTFDAGTDAAVRAFQANEERLMPGFGVDGVVGRTTWAALGYVVPQY